MSTAAVDTTQAAAATATLSPTILTYLSKVIEILHGDIVVICLLSVTSTETLGRNSMTGYCCNKQPIHAS